MASKTNEPELRKQRAPTKQATRNESKHSSRLGKKLLLKTRMSF